jgi:hypothetical protein
VCDPSCVQDAITWNMVIAHRSNFCRIYIVLIAVDEMDCRGVSLIVCEPKMSRRQEWAPRGEQSGPRYPSIMAAVLLGQASMHPRIYYDYVRLSNYLHSYCSWNHLFHRDARRHRFDQIRLSDILRRS